MTESAGHNPPRSVCVRSGRATVDLVRPPACPIHNTAHLVLERHGGIAKGEARLLARHWGEDQPEAEPYANPGNQSGSVRPAAADLKIAGLKARGEALTRAHRIPGIVAFAQHAGQR